MKNQRELLQKLVKQLSGVFGDGMGFMQNSYFSQGSGYIKSPKENIEVSRLGTNDRIKIELDYDKNTVNYYKNDGLLGSLRIHRRLEEVLFYHYLILF